MPVSFDPASYSWRTGWHFLALGHDLADDGAHVTVDLPDLSITVQNFRGDLAGFWNVCSHRSIQMRDAGCGTGPLRCPYHGWTYNRDGVPIGIPDNEDLFGLDKAAKQALALTQIEVATRGPVVFFRVDPGEGKPAPDDLAEGMVPVADHAVDGPADLAFNSGWGMELPVRAANLAVRMEEGWALLLAALPQGRAPAAVRLRLLAPATGGALPATLARLVERAVGVTP